jgi:hypothetical protein
MTDWSLDAIGKRLRGEGLSAEERVLAEDDKVRVAWVLDHSRPFWNVVDVGASDGSIADAMRELHNPGLFLIERHPAHVAALSTRGMWMFYGEAIDGLKALPYMYERTACLCGELLEHLSQEDGAALLRAIGDSIRDLIVTVPNRNAVSYEATGRSRWGWPDHVRWFNQSDLPLWLESCGWNVVTLEPIVGTLDDSIWLGAVCRRA